MLFESSSEFVVKKLGLGSRLEFISRWDVSGSWKKGLNIFCLWSWGSKFASKWKSNSAKKKSISSSKWLNGNRVARQTEQNQSLLALDKAMYCSQVKGVHFNFVQFSHMSHKMAKFTHSTWVLNRHRTTTTTTKINAMSVLTNKCKYVSKKYTSK